jgi:HEAT repeat protein
MRRHRVRNPAILAILLAMSAGSVLGSGVLTEKYRHRYSDLEEADVDSVIALLAAADTAVRRDALILVRSAFNKGFPSAQKAVPILIRLLDDEVNVTVRGGAAAALALSGDERAVEPLLNLVREKDLDKSLVATVFRGLMRMGVTNEEIMKVASEHLGCSDLGLRKASIAMLGSSEDREDLKKVVDLYIDHIEHPDSSLMVTPPAVRHLFKNAYDELSWWLRIKLLGVALSAPDVLEPLLDHPNQEIRYQAAQAFATRHEKRGISTLLDLLANAEDWRHRCLAAHALAGYGKADLGEDLEAVVSALEEALNDSHEEEGDRGPYRPLVCAAYSSLRQLGVNVERPYDLRYKPIRWLH